jgi:hypothetical protein
VREARRPAQKSESVGVVAEVADEARAHGIAEVRKSVKRDLIQKKRRPTDTGIRVRKCVCVKRDLTNQQKSPVLSEKEP